MRLPTCYAQIITTVLKHLTRGVPPLTMRSKCKTPPDYLGKQSGEAEMVVFRSTLVQGVLDKAAYGKFGLVHAFHVRYSMKHNNNQRLWFCALWRWVVQIVMHVVVFVV